MIIHFRNSREPVILQQDLVLYYAFIVQTLLGH